MWHVHENTEDKEKSSYLENPLMSRCKIQFDRWIDQFVINKLNVKLIEASRQVQLHFFQSLPPYETELPE